MLAPVGIAAVTMSEAQAGHSFLRLPERRPQSIRRTSSVQCWFPSGADGDRRITAIARDLFTGHDSRAPQVLARERLEMTVGRSRDIGIARDESNSRDLDFMTGLSFGRPIRGAVATHFSKELAERSLFIRLLDEIPGPIGLAHDVWHEDNVICANTQFQDSGSLPDSGNYRRVMHEYRVTAIIDPCDFVLRAVEVTPGMLPFPTCLAAPESAGGLVGHPVSTFGKLVSMDLTGTAGCTHLNEALKALQDVPAIAREVRSSC